MRVRPANTNWHSEHDPTVLPDHAGESEALPAQCRRPAARTNYIANS
jgi:hypothetical protein